MVIISRVGDSHIGFVFGFIKVSREEEHYT